MLENAVSNIGKSKVEGDSSLSTLVFNYVCFIYEFIRKTFKGLSI